MQGRPRPAVLEVSSNKRIPEEGLRRSPSSAIVEDQAGGCGVTEMEVSGDKEAGYVQVVTESEGDGSAMEAPEMVGGAAAGDGVSESFFEVLWAALSPAVEPRC